MNDHRIEQVVDLLTILDGHPTPQNRAMARRLRAVLSRRELAVIDLLMTKAA